MESKRKNSYSHRFKAVKKLLYSLLKKAMSEFKHIAVMPSETLLELNVEEKEGLIKITLI